MLLLSDPAVQGGIDLQFVRGQVRPYEGVEGRTKELSDGNGRYASVPAGVVDEGEVVVASRLQHGGILEAGFGLEPGRQVFPYFECGGRLGRRPVVEQVDRRGGFVEVGDGSDAPGLHLLDPRSRLA